MIRPRVTVNYLWHISHISLGCCNLSAYVSLTVRVIVFMMSDHLFFLAHSLSVSLQYEQRWKVGGTGPTQCTLHTSGDEDVFSIAVATLLIPHGRDSGGVVRRTIKTYYVGLWAAEWAVQSVRFEGVSSWNIHSSSYWHKMGYICSISSHQNNVVTALFMKI